MSFYLNSNVSSLNALRHYNQVGLETNKSLERLSSGYRINHASDSASGLMVSETLRAQVRGYDAATSNVQQGLSMLQIADSSLQQIYEHVQSIRDIAVAASNGTTTTAQYAAYSDQILAEVKTIDQIANGTRYGSVGLLSGSALGTPFNIQIGPNSGDTIDINSALTNNTATAPGLGITQVAIADATQAGTLLGQVDSALATASDHLALIGGFENQLTNQMNYISVAKENVSAAEAHIRNTDVAYQTSLLARQQIIQQAAVYAMVQANSMPATVTDLLLRN